MPEFTLGPWRVEPARNVISRDGEQRHLENRLMQTLVFLVRNAGRVVTRQQFFESVWHGLVVNEEALSRAVSLLRSALEDDARAPQFIQTVPGVGYRLIAEAVIARERRDGAASGSAVQENSIAVLPFRNFSDDPANEYFSDGISEEILNVLAQNERFKVTGRTSSFVFKDRNEDLREIGRTLGVAHVLEGSVRKAGTRVRITAQLIKADDGFHLWSETFDRELDDIFVVQDEIASAVARALKIRLLGHTAEHQLVGGTRDAQAFQCYLLGMHHRNRGALKETVRLAAEAFERAIELDPDYAKAHAALAYTWIDRVWNGYTSQEEGVREIAGLAARAIELAPGMADGYLALGLLREIELRDFRSVLEALRIARERNPGNPRMQIQYARLNAHYGNAEAAIAAAQRAVELDPVSVYANHILGHVLYFSRRYEEAIRAFRHTLELDRGYPKPHYFISMCHFWLGQTDLALREAELEPLDWMRWTASAVILHRLGRIAEAEANFASLEAIGTAENNYMQQAGIHAQLGDTERAFECLDVAWSLRDPGFTQALVDPFLDPLREEPRFAELLVKAGLVNAPNPS